MLKKYLKKLFIMCPSYRQREYQINLQHTIISKLNDISDLMTVMLLLKNDILKFIYHDREIKFYLPHGGIDFSQKIILKFCNFYEIKELEYCWKLIPENAVIIDAGANIGNHSVFFSMFYMADKVIAFEPQKIIYSILQKNLELNEIDNVEAYNCALGDCEGYVEVSNSIPTSVGETRFITTSENKLGAVKKITVDSLTLERLDFMKIDVEGAQLDVLRGASKTIKRCKPYIWCEMNMESSVFPEAHDVLRETVLAHEFLLSLGYGLKKDFGNSNYLYGPAKER